MILEGEKDLSEVLWPDREGEFEPKIKTIDGLDQKILSMYGQGNEYITG